MSTLTHEDLRAAIQTARGMVEANRVEAVDPDNLDDDRFGAGQAAYGQAAVIEVFAALIGEDSGYDLNDLGWLR